MYVNAHEKDVQCQGGTKVINLFESLQVMFLHL